MSCTCLEKLLSAIETEDGREMALMMSYQPKVMLAFLVRKAMRTPSPVEEPIPGIDSMVIPK